MGELPDDGAQPMVGPDGLAKCARCGDRLYLTTNKSIRHASNESLYCAGTVAEIKERGNWGLPTK